MPPEQPVQREHAGLAQRASIFVGFALLGAWHIARLQSPALAVGDLVLPLVLALALAAAALRGRRVLASACLLWVVSVAALAGRTAPSRAHPLATFSEAFARLHEGAGNFSSVLLPFDPVAEPGMHALIVAGAALWLLALALAWLVAARPLPTIVLGALPVALVSSEFSQPRPGLRVALLVALIVLTLGAGRRGGLRPVAVFGAPLVLIALVGVSLPGLARASLFDWHAWGRGSGGAGAATDVRYAWDQSYDGLHYSGPPVVVLRVRSPRPSYWRVTALDSFDGVRFEERAPAVVVARAGAEALAQPRPVGQATTLQIETEALDEPYLVGAGNPVSFRVPAATGGGTIDGNGVLRVLRPPTRGTTYTVSAVIADPTRAKLRHPGSTSAEPGVDSLDGTPFPDEQPLPAFGDPAHAAAVETMLASRPAWRAAYAWALHATAGARTPYDVALRLEQTLRSSHPYDGSSTLPQSDPDALAHWITSGAAGYCQMFSASMTELLRLLGVRARIAEGFVTGSYDPASKSYVVDDRDAHAWVEAWLPGSGFVPFDPTPGRSLPTRASSSSGLAPGQTASTSTVRTRSVPTTTTVPSGAGGARSIGSRAADVTRGSTFRVVAVAVLGLLLLVAAAIAGARARGWQPRARGPRAEAGASRTRLAMRARRRGLELPPGVTNGELAHALGRLEIDARAWVDAADRAAYAVDDDAEEAVETLRAETRRLAKEIASNRRVTLPV